MTSEKFQKVNSYLAESRQHIIYVAHRLGGKEPARTENIEKARNWMRWLLLRYPQHAFFAPWITYAESLEETHRERGMRDNRLFLNRATLLLLVGPEVSPGMQEEANWAEQYGIPTLNMTGISIL